MSRVGQDIVEAMGELAAYLRGEADVETYDVPSETLTADRIGRIRRSVARSTLAFEAEFRIPARTMESYEQGRRRPDAATSALLRVIEREPDAVRRALRMG